MSRDTWISIGRGTRAEVTTPNKLFQRLHNNEGQITNVHLEHKSRNTGMSAEVKECHATQFQKQKAAVVAVTVTRSSELCLTQCNGLQQHQHHTQRLRLLREATAQLTAAFKEDKKQRRVLEWIITGHCMWSCSEKISQAAPMRSVNYFATPVTKLMCAPWS